METSLVLFALTKQGSMELFDLARGRRAAIWVNHGILDASALALLRDEGFDLTDFTSWIDPSDDVAIQSALETIREHHPGHVLYVERR